MVPPKIAIKNLSKIYRGKGEVVALQAFNLEVSVGEMVCIIGPSGCGKSTLLRILAGLYQQTSGEVVFLQGSPVTQNVTQKPLNNMVFQEYAIFPWKTVLDNIAFGLKMRGFTRKARYEIAEHYIAKVGLQAFKHHYPYQLSGGMKQRVSIARAFANDPEVLLMDEPFGALDAQTRMILQEELLRIWEEDRKTVVYVTHSIEEALLLGDRVVVMTAQPGTKKGEFRVELPRPRTLEVKNHPAFTALAYQIWKFLEEEVKRSMAGPPLTETGRSRG